MPDIRQPVRDLPLLPLLVCHVRRHPFLVRVDQRHQLDRLCLADEVSATENRHAGVIAPVVVDRDLFLDDIRHFGMPEKLVVEPHALRRDHALHALALEDRHRRPIRRIAARLFRLAIPLVRGKPVLADVVFVLGQQLLREALGKGFKGHQLAAFLHPAEDAPVIFGSFFRRIAAPAGKFADKIFQCAEGAFHVLRPAAIRQRMVYAHAQRPKQAFLFGKFSVQAAQIGFHQRFALEPMASVILAVVDVDVARQTVNVAALRIHRRPAEAVGNRVAVRLQRQLPADEFLGTSVHPSRHPRAHQIVVLVQHEQVNLVVIAEPDFVGHRRLASLGFLHVRRFPCPLAVTGEGHLCLIHRFHDAVDRVAVRRNHHRAACHGADGVFLPVCRSERPPRVRSVAVHAAVAGVFAVFRCPLPQALQHQRLRKLPIVAHLRLDEVPRQLAARPALPLVPALHLVHDRRQPALLVCRVPTPQRPARHTQRPRQRVHRRRPAPLAAVQDAVQRHDRLLAICQLGQPFLAEGFLVRRKVRSRNLGG